MGEKKFFSNFAPMSELSLFNEFYSKLPDTIEQLYLCNGMLPTLAKVPKDLPVGDLYKMPSNLKILELMDIDDHLALDKLIPGIKLIYLGIFTDYDSASRQLPYNKVTSKKAMLLNVKHLSQSNHLRFQYISTEGNSPLFYSELKKFLLKLDIMNTTRTIFYTANRLNKTRQPSSNNTNLARLPNAIVINILNFYSQLLSLKADISKLNYFNTTKKENNCIDEKSSGSCGDAYRLNPKLHINNHPFFKSRMQPSHEHNKKTDSNSCLHNILKTEDGFGVELKFYYLKIVIVTDDFDSII